MPPIADQLPRHTYQDRDIDMPTYEGYRIVINEAQRRLIMRALTNAMANDRLSTEGGALSRSTPDEWMQLIRLFSTIEPSVQKLRPDLTKPARLVATAERTI